MWGAVFWIALPYPNRVIHPLPWDTSRAAALARELDTGVYYYPPEPARPPEVSREEGERLWEEFLEKHRQCPILLLQFRSEGREAMSPVVFLQGFLHFLLLAFLVAMLLARAAPALGFGGRLLFVFLAGLLLAAAELSHAIWWQTPWGLPLLDAACELPGWVLCAPVLAWIVRARPAVAQLPRS